VIGVQKIVALWHWFVEGLTDATIACAAALDRRRSVQLVLEREPPQLRERSGNEIGRIRLDQPASTEPASLREKLAGAYLDVVVPSTLVLHRSLNSLPAESAPFLEAFVRHQIERITPWKVADAYFGTSTARIPGQPPRLAVTVHVVARCLLEDALTAARELKPARLRLLLPALEGESVVVSIDDDQKSRRTRARAIVRMAVVGLIALIACGVAFFPWQLATVQSETSEVESQIEDQRSALSALRSDSGHFNVKDILALRGARPRIVETLEAMSAALPDDDYLTSLHISGDDIHISGISTKTSDLVPALEGSGHFRDARFGEPITRMEKGDANRFDLSMHIVPPGKVASR
jgi:general secretion pathway protein L